jgi:hypothetical protein
MSSIVRHAVSAPFLAILLALALALAVLPGVGDAWGPFDGAYQLSLDFQGVQSVAYMIVMQDGPNIGVVFLAPACPQQTIDCLSPTWNYGLGLPTGAAGQYQGSTLAANGNPVGSFTLQFSGDAVTGTTFTIGFGDSTASGTRFWGANPAF